MTRIRFGGCDLSPRVGGTPSDCQNLARLRLQPVQRGRNDAVITVLL